MATNRTPYPIRGHPLFSSVYLFVLTHVPDRTSTLIRVHSSLLRIKLLVLPALIRFCPSDPRYITSLLRQRIKLFKPLLLLVFA